MVGRVLVIGRWLAASLALSLGGLACSGNSAQVPPPPGGATNATEPGGSAAAGTSSANGDAGTTGGATADAATSGDDAEAPGPWPGSQVFFFHFPPQKQASHPSWGTALTDIVRHLHPTYGAQYDYPDDRITWGTLVSHGISSHLRFAYNVTGKPANGLYLMQDRATLVVEPKIHLTDIAPRVPASLRGARWQSAVVGPAKDWNDTPTFVLEQWIASTNGSEVGIDLVKQGLWGTTVRDAVGGTFELNLYAFAFGLAVEELDPTYFAENPLTRELLAWNTERAMRLFAEGSQMPPFTNLAQEDLATKWKTAADAAPLRNFARKLFGGSYCVKVLGIGAHAE